MQQYIAVVDGDKRQKALCEILKRQGLLARLFFLNNETVLTDLAQLGACKALVLPVPTTRNGETLNAPQLTPPLPLATVLSVLQPGTPVFTGGTAPCFAEFKNLNFCNLLAQEPLVLKNALATAEAALAIVITQTPHTVFKSNVLLLGYGRIAQYLAKYLKNLGAAVTVAARNEVARTKAATAGSTALTFEQAEVYLPHFNVIVNTVPQTVLFKRQLLKVSPGCLLVDRASKPGGIDYKAAEILRLNTVQALGLPGKYSPNSAAQYMAEAITARLKELSLI